jgi:hypothetical protein
VEEEEKKEKRRKRRENAVAEGKDEGEMMEVENTERMEVREYM